MSWLNPGPRLASTVASMARLAALSVAPGLLLLGPGAKAAPQLDKVKVAVDGKPLPIKGAVVYTTGGSALTLEVSTEPLTCSAFEGRRRNVAEGERSLRVRFQPLLQADGSLKWRTVGLEMQQQGPAHGTDLSKLTLVDPDPRKPVGFRFDHKLVLPESTFFDRPEIKLDLHGDGVALGCGLLKGDEEIPARPQAGLKLTVAGRSFPVLSATLTGDGGQLELTTSPQTCVGGENHDLRLRIQVKPGDEQQHAIYVSGDVLDSQHNLSARHLAAPASVSAAATGGEPGLFVQVTPGAAKGAPRTVKVAGAFRLGELPVTLEGEVSALDCTDAR